MIETDLQRVRAWYAEVAPLAPRLLAIEQEIESLGVTAERLTALLAAWLEYGEICDRHEFMGPGREEILATWQNAFASKTDKATINGDLICMATAAFYAEDFRLDEAGAMDGRMDAAKAAAHLLQKILPKLPENPSEAEFIAAWTAEKERREGTRRRRPRCRPSRDSSAQEKDRGNGRFPARSRHPDH